MLIAYVINKIKKILFDNTKDDNSNLFCIIPFVFQILSLLFYLEILEYNFCGLNKNTKKNIRLREKEEMVFRETKFNEIELAEDLVIKEDQFNEKLKIFSKDEERNSNES